MDNKISQPSSHANSKMVAKNTILLYARMFLTMAVGLFTSRVVLNSLGVDDYGLYNVVGGIVVILGFLNSAMTGATQRFLNFELGRHNTPTDELPIYLAAGISLTAKGWAESLGIKYIAAHDQDSVKVGVKQLLQTDSDQPVLMEVFSDLSEDRFCIQDYTVKLDRRSLADKVSNKLMNFKFRK